MTAPKKRVVVVLGMHRSGTSVLTHALEAMGVDLGDHLMPPAAGNNEKGFFEDVEINAINVDLLKAFGDDWKSLASISADDQVSDKVASFRRRAVSVLEHRLERSAIFGFKDPRICRLLPFWQDVFAHLQVDDSYVIAVRNPLSVASSLDQRDKLPFEQSCFLWLLYMLPSVMLTAGRPRVVVDYDLLVDAPAPELRRIARSLDLQDRLAEEAVSAFAGQFMEERLRHAAFTLEESAADPRVPAPVHRMFSLLLDVARLRTGLEAPGNEAVLEELAVRFGELPRVFGFIGEDQHRILELQRIVDDKQTHIVHIESGYEEASRRLGESATAVAELRRQVHDKDVHIGHIENGYKDVLRRLGDSQAEIARMAKQVHDKDVHIGHIENGYQEVARHLGETQAEVARFRKLVHERDEGIGKLAARVAELTRQLAAVRADLTQQLAAVRVEAQDLASQLRDKDVRIGNLDAEAQDLASQLRDKDMHIGNLDVHIGNLRESIDRLQVHNAMLDHRAAQHRASVAWTLAKPIRSLWGLAWRLGAPRTVDLVPLAQLVRQGSGWMAEGPQPQFLLQAARAWHGLPGWHTLRLRPVVPEACTMTVGFETSAGSREALRFAVPADLQQPLELPVFIPRGCLAVRLQPCDKPLAFELAHCSLRRLATPPAIPSQPGVYERLGARTGNAAGLVPAGGMRPLPDDEDYGWAAEHTDPHFQVTGGHRLRPGWYMAEVLVHSSLDGGAAKLYFDHGSGYSEEHAVTLPFRSGTVVKRLLRLDRAPVQVRFDPIERQVRFSVARLNFTRVWPSFARDRMLRRLRMHIGEFKGRSPGEVRALLKTEAKAQGKPVDDVLLARYGTTFASFEGVISYPEWIEAVERPSLPSRDEVQRLLASIEPKPLFSVLVPTYNTDPDHLRACLDSVCRQSYPRWELCIADDASPRPHVTEILRSYQERDPRIKVCYREENGHISRASNSALQLATGDYVVLLDHDDVLAEHALLFVAETIHRRPEAQILYSDEDKLDARGKRVDPHFKSDWNPDLFYAQNFVSHLGVYRRSLLSTIGGFRTGVEGSQDQDLLLRCLPHVRESAIVHVPRVLYHWRTVAGSTALDSREKSYTTSAGLRALREHFDSQGQPGVQLETGALPNSYRVRWPLPEPAPLASLIIPTRDRRAITEVAVRSILDKTTYPNFEILIVDNGSVEPETLEFFEAIQREDARVRVLRYDAPFNFSAINNYAERHARGEILGLVNNDVEVINPEWLTEMVSHACRPEIGCVGAKLYYSNDTLQHAGVILGLGGVAGHSHKGAPRHSMGYYGRLQLVQSLSAVTAACLVVRREVYRAVGGLDEKNLVVAFNDVDFCLRVRAAGYRNLWTPYAELYHHESISRGAEDTPEKLERFKAEVRYMTETWPGELAADPYYNPNLTYDREDFSIECRHR